MSLEDLIDNIGTQNFAKANGVFDDLMKSKMADALDAEQVRLANAIYNDEDLDGEEWDEDESDEDESDEDESDEDDEDDDDESDEDDEDE
jgi:hypothetical protein